MKVWMTMLLLVLVPLPVSAQGSSTRHRDHGFPAGYHAAEPRPESATGIRKHAEDAQAGAQRNFGLQPVHDNEPFGVFMLERLEYRSTEGEGSLLWDAQGWVGSDYNRFELESEGVRLLETDRFEEVELELFYSRTIAAFWDLRVGLRHDLEPDPERTFAAVGVEGLAPYWFELESTIYISEDGDVSAGLEAEYDLLLSQRLILQPRFETAVALQEVEPFGIGQGVNDIELGLRLRYEVHRKLAPYVGVSWHRKLGETADLAEAAGEETGAFFVLVGVRAWF
jgi:copper resistance protein B